MGFLFFDTLSTLTPLGYFAILFYTLCQTFPSCCDHPLSLNYKKRKPEHFVLTFRVMFYRKFLSD